MNPVLQEILDILNVESIERNLYRGRNHATEHVFGGQVMAQALTAAYRTVEASHHLHSLHAYFLRTGHRQIPILYEVDRIRDGRSFSTRRVAATQEGKAIFTLSCSWHKNEQGVDHSQPMPHVPPPESLRSDLDVYESLLEKQPDIFPFSFRHKAIDSRQVERILPNDTFEHPPFKHTWLKTRDRLPDDADVHLALMAYMSDLDFLSTALLPHGRTARRESMVRASLDHSMWFHRPFRADEWLLFARESPNASGARGFVRGHFFDRAGELVATAAQECLMRPVGEVRERLLSEATPVPGSINSVRRPVA